MSDNLAATTSYTLLGVLADPKGSGWNDAWYRFAAQYDRAIRVWGKRYGCPEEDLHGLAQEVLIRLHRAMARWEVRRWLRGVADAATRTWAGETNESPQQVNDLLHWLVSRVDDEVLDALSSRRPALDQATDDAARESAWGRFVETYQPVVAAAFEKCGHDPAGADGWLGVLRGVVWTLPAGVLPPFRPWLHAVVRNAARDCLASNRRAQSLGEARLEAITTDVQARDDFVDGVVAQEAQAEAVRRARGRVSDRDWEIFTAACDRRVRGADVAKQFGVSVDVVYQVTRRTRRVLEEALAEVAGECRKAVEE